MNRLFRAVLALAFLALAAGCIPDKFATPAEEARAQHWIGELRARHFDAIAAAMDPGIHADDLPGVLARMADAIPAGAPTAVTLVGDNHVSSPAGTLVNLTYEYAIGGRWLLFNVAIRSSAGVDTIVGLNAYGLPRSLEDLNRFGLADKPAACYAVLALAILMPAFTLFALGVCARTTLRGRKWPWVVFILVGFGRIAVDWATGQWDIHIVHFQLFSAAAVAAPHGPWIVSAALPIGALVFLVRRRSLMAPAPAPASLPDPVAATE